jgi:hypothetical protein
MPRRPQSLHSVPRSAGFEAPPHLHKTQRGGGHYPPMAPASRGGVPDEVKSTGVVYESDPRRGLGADRAEDGGGLLIAGRIGSRGLGVARGTPGRGSGVARPIRMNVPHVPDEERVPSCLQTKSRRRSTKHLDRPRTQRCPNWGLMALTCSSWTATCCSHTAAANFSVDSRGGWVRSSPYLRARVGHRRARSSSPRGDRRAALHVDGIGSKHAEAANLADPSW